MRFDAIPQAQALADVMHRWGAGAPWAVRRSSSRFCLGVEHGDYNGTRLLGVGTDRFIWLVHRTVDAPRLRLWSANFPEEGEVELPFEALPAAETVSGQWARFPAGVLAVLSQAGFELKQGLDILVVGNIPGGGMSRSASLTLNLLETLRAVHGWPVEGPLQWPLLAQRVENDFIGSPCGLLDQVMIYHARAEAATLYDPATGEVRHLPLGAAAEPFALVSLDTGTQRHGLERSTYSIRVKECRELAEWLQEHYGLAQVGAVRDPDVFETVWKALIQHRPLLLKRLKYIYEAQQRFDQMLEAWDTGDIPRLGALFRADGHGLRDDYAISGPELETMCDIARGVEGVYGERMLGGGDKGASGAIVAEDAWPQLEAAVRRGYPRAFPDLAGRFAVHRLNRVKGLEAAPLEGF